MIKYIECVEAVFENDRVKPRVLFGNDRIYAKWNRELYNKHGVYRNDKIYAE